MIYWNKDKTYRNVLYMNIVFLIFLILGIFQTINNGYSWIFYILMCILIVGFNIERWLHYKAYSKTIWG